MRHALTAKILKQKLKQQQEHNAVLFGMIHC